MKLSPGTKIVLNIECDIHCEMCREIVGNYISPCPSCGQISYTKDYYGDLSEGLKLDQRVDIECATCHTSYRLCREGTSEGAPYDDDYEWAVL